MKTLFAIFSLFIATSVAHANLNDTEKRSIDLTTYAATNVITTLSTENSRSGNCFYLGGMDLVSLDFIDSGRFSKDRAISEAADKLEEINDLTFQYCLNNPTSSDKRTLLEKVSAIKKTLQSLK